MGAWGRSAGRRWAVRRTVRRCVCRCGWRVGGAVGGGREACVGGAFGGAGVRWGGDRCTGEVPVFSFFEELFAPGRKHTREEQNRLELTREDVGDGAPGRGPIDLASGKVIVRRAPGDR
ncbi:DUF6191 domain-containing protein [Streptomyces sp. NPDC091279]|uniref:DUF6191 domain-containing protein n=1 Tax=Streptomyces sp. NPDC091279 TaxID=3365983 RepID=UPI00381B19A5